MNIEQFTSLCLTYAVACYIVFIAFGVWYDSNTRKKQPKPYRLGREYTRVGVQRQINKLKSNRS